MQRSVWRIAALISSFCAAALISAACGGQDYPETVFSCDPSERDSCPDTHVCCSTDAAALDLDSLTAEVLPSYAGGSGTPLFSGVNNDQSRHGRCVDVGRVAGVEVLGGDDGDAEGCPRPCNPLWLGADITTVCGEDTVCCPTEEIGEKDCVFDPGIGVNGCYRPVTGNDIQTFGGLESTAWGTNEHDTHQDPRGLNCQDFAESQGGASDAVVRACYQRLTVANQRGLCTPAGGATDPAEVCPLSDPGHRDACEELNDAEALIGCEVVDFP